MRWKINDVVVRNNQYDKIPEFDYSKLRKAVGKVIRLIPGDLETKRKVEVLWAWPNGETKLSQHHPWELKTL